MYGKGELTIEEVIASRPIAEPFHYLDCSIPSDGGGAILVTRAELGRELSRQPAYVLGYGEYHPRGTISSAGDLVETGAVRTGKEAFAAAGMTPADIDVAQLYDAFSATPLMLLENLGFCAPGTSGEFVRSGAADPGGSLPMNTFGGLLSFGHTGDSSGMSVLIEGAKQAMGTAGDRQVAHAEKVLVHCYGGMMYDHTTLILGREP
jgi:acetyl-CoA acetyltransferase